MHLQLPFGFLLADTPDLKTDELWVLVCAALVFFMQAGFCCMEAGLVRSKNSIDSAIKNLFDFCVTGVLFWAVGYALMFGAEPEWISGLIGWSDFCFHPERNGGGGASSDRAEWASVFFLFQLGYCATSITIVSGSVAERMRFAPYLLLAIVVGTVIYPVFGHWAWAGLEDSMPGEAPEYVGWLGKIGFTDFAGSTVVHSLGAWVAWAAVIVVGKRTDRDEHKHLPGHDLPLTALGLFILWLGWFGFTAGRTFAEVDSPSFVIINTLLAGAFGGIGAVVIDLVWPRIFKRLPASLAKLRHPFGERPETEELLAFHVEPLMNGVLAGLVAICASCNVASPFQTAAIALGASAAMYAGTIVLHWLDHDDVVGAIPTFGFAGFWGTIAAGFVVPGGNPLMQVVGAIVCFVWAFGLSYVLLKILSRVSDTSPFRLRLTVEGEKRGFNRVQHGASTEFDNLIETMRRNLQTGRRDLAEADDFTLAGELAELHNLMIDRQNELDDAIEEAQEKRVAEQANRTKTALFSSITHELRTPMTAIKGFAEILADAVDDEEVRRDSAERILRNSDHMLSLINDVLDFAKLEAGRMDAELENVNIRDLVQDVVGMVVGRAAGSSVALTSRVRAQTPRAIRTDATRLRQVLLNLLGNAIKFTEAGEVKLLVRLSVPNGQPVVCFDVIDTGPGMTEQTRANLFQPFVQGKQKSVERQAGSGLGLAICKRLMDLLDGQIHVHSEVGKGSTFTVELPVSLDDDVDDVDDSRDVELTSSNAGTADHPEPRIPLEGHVLLAEDSADNQRLVRFMLERAGLRVEIAADGREAVRLLLEREFSERPFDVVLMDLRMPNVDGYEATQQIRLAGFTRPIVALTAHGMSGTREDCLASGFDDFAEKPIDESDLLRTLQVQLSRLTAEAIAAPACHSAKAASYGPLIDEFIAGVLRYITRMNESLSASDLDGLYEIAHELKGAAGSHGFFQVTPIAQALLDALSDDQNRSVDAVRPLVERMGDVLAKLEPGHADVAFPDSSSES